MYEDFLDEWEKEDPFQFTGSGKRETSHFAPYAQDALHIYLKALHYVTIGPGVTVTTDAILTILSKHARGCPASGRDSRLVSIGGDRSRGSPKVGASYQRNRLTPDAQ